ncbi:carboxymuconolactone decarboxylase family protein [Chachezhania sediminis]|uniref:hypothetical protein n=1 Tax=Chachezhania sediminis TaxID=2599291 RepID=UPI00131DDA23|nr:hypothetical protein [Chachezhania sediminis]
MTTTANLPESKRLPLRQPPYDDETRKAIDNTAFKGLSPGNLRLSMAHHPALAGRFQALAHEVLFGAEVALRAKEIAIMRTTARAGAEYPWGMHVAIYGDRCALDRDMCMELATAEDWQALTDLRWTDEDRLMVRMADELHEDADVADATWALMNERWPVSQVIELVFACGVYRLASYYTKTTAVPLEIGQAHFPEGHRRE